MKDTSHHRKYVQKKVIQSIRRENNQVKNNTINGFDILVKEASSPPKEAPKSL